MKGADRPPFDVLFTLLIPLFWNNLILQSVAALFAGTNLDHIVHRVHKNLAIADMTGIERLLGSLDDRP